MMNLYSFDEPITPGDDPKPATKATQQAPLLRAGNGCVGFQAQGAYRVSYQSQGCSGGLGSGAQASSGCSGGSGRGYLLPGRAARVEHRHAKQAARRGGGCDVQFVEEPQPQASFATFAPQQQQAPPAQTAAAPSQPAIVGYQRVCLGPNNCYWQPVYQAAQ